MNRKNILCWLIFASATAFAQIEPVDIAVSQDAQSKVVTISYKIAATETTETQTIVTADFQTNTLSDATGDWVSIGGEHYRSVCGDINHAMTIDTSMTYVFKWVPDVDWPNHDLPANALRVELKPWSLKDPPTYWAIDFSGKGLHSYYPNVESLPDGIESDRWRMSEMLMRKIPARNATFTQGSPADEAGRSTVTDNETAHKVMFSHNYYIGVFELTQIQYMFAAGNLLAAKFSNRAHWATRPNEYADFADRMHDNTDPTSSDPAVVHQCVKYDWCPMVKLRSYSRLDYYFDFPTEAQWEFACRAGSTNALYNGTEITTLSGRDDNLAKLARNKWTVENTAADYACSTNSGTARVGSYLPNAWGLYDMLGNVSEMCLDYSGTYAWVTEEVTTDPQGSSTSSNYRLARGGNYSSDNRYCRSAARFDTHQAWIASSTTGERMSYSLVNDTEAAECAEGTAELTTALATAPAANGEMTSASLSLRVGPDPLVVELK